MTVAVMDAFLVWGVCELGCVVLLVGRLKVPFLILFNTVSGKRNPNWLVTMLPSALLTSDLVQFVDCDLA